MARVFELVPSVLEPAHGHKSDLARARRQEGGEHEAREVEALLVGLGLGLKGEGRVRVRVRVRVRLEKLQPSLTRSSASSRRSPFCRARDATSIM